MSGLDEMNKLWVLTYEEFHIEDYLTCYRGLIARDKLTAEEKGKLWIKHLNLEYNRSEDADYPDYKYVTIAEPGVDFTLFILSERVFSDAEADIKKWEAGELDVD